MNTSIIFYTKFVPVFCPRQSDNEAIFRVDLNAVGQTAAAVPGYRTNRCARRALTLSLKKKIVGIGEVSFAHIQSSEPRTVVIRDLCYLFILTLDGVTCY